MADRDRPGTHSCLEIYKVLTLFLESKPLQALEHPSFHKMIGIAARATNGVTIPNRKATRDEIMDMFKTQMSHLKNHFSVRSLWQPTRIKLLILPYRVRLLLAKLV